MPECLECGKAFVPKTKRSFFCSKKCRYKAYDRHPADTKDTPKAAVCAVCKKPFVKKKRNQRYCARGCYLVAWPILNREKHNTRQRTKRAKNLALFRRRDTTYAQTHRAKLTSVYPWAYLFKSRRNEAKLKNIPFELDHEWAAEHWFKGCAVTGLPFRRNERKGPWPFSPSIDQIRPGLGYTKSNARFILWGVNALKGVGTDADMRKIARAIVRTARRGL